MQIVDPSPHPFVRRPAVHAGSSSQSPFSDPIETQMIFEKVKRGREDVAAGRMLSADAVEAECEALLG